MEVIGRGLHDFGEHRGHPSRGQSHSGPRRLRTAHATPRARTRESQALRNYPQPAGFAPHCRPLAPQPRARRLRDHASPGNLRMASRAHSRTPGSPQPRMVSAPRPAPPVSADPAAEPPLPSRHAGRNPRSPASSGRSPRARLGARSESHRLEAQPDAPRPSLLANGP